MLTRAEQEIALSEISRVIAQVPAYCIFEWHVEPHLASINEFARAMTRNATLDSSLVNIRCLDEFFRSGKYRDDITVFNFTNAAAKHFLSNDEKSEINKALAHFTKTRLQRPEGGFFIYEMILKAMIYGAEFLKYVLDEVTFNDAAIQKEVQGVFSASSAVIREIIQRHKKDETNFSELEELLKKAGIA